MELLNKIIHKNISDINGNPSKRRTARGIIVNGSEILLMYTKFYNDYSFPGGGVNKEEDLKTALKRELYEEIGASKIEILKEYGMLEEYRPTSDPEYDFAYMESYFFVCQVEKELGTPNLEDYEIAHGMKPVWIDINKAIAHNKAVIDNKEESMGLSIRRETFVLEHIRDHLIKK
ncbi:NUDIX hydrolase [Haloplasma contractile]|uniref:RNA pyrophosphohydrolase protein n=1 Tax=Haloplasma contractile SSD-17B TaxID=1033810 RepID=U2DUP2_9MOLU|nr:NUDIX domain-containing protein [Haloplasma contractile]ERJ12127.1 RNA pyrophosphohydrolase protein [Haloplasma contractile SSD-17B]